MSRTTLEPELESAESIPEEGAEEEGAGRGKKGGDG